jgi:hypothetical protein
VQLPAIAAGMLGAIMPVFRYDSLAISLHGKRIADALAETAETVPSVAAVLDKAANIGPYALIVTAVTPLVVQIAANHGMIKPGMMGSLSHDELHRTVAPESFNEMVLARMEAAKRAAESNGYRSGSDQDAGVSDAA